MSDLRFKPAYNPYTEPSMEIFAFHKGKILNNSILLKISVKRI